MSDLLYRPDRDRLAAEARELWHRPADGEVSISLNRSKLEAICVLFAGYIYSDVSGLEPLKRMIDVVQGDLFGELGRQSALAERDQPRGKESP